MINDKRQITVVQLFCMLFISRIIVNMTYNPMLTGGENMWDHVVSCAIAFVLVFIMAIPVYKLYYIGKEKDIVDISYSLSDKIGVIISFIYFLYYTFVSVYTLSIFDSFVFSAMDPKTPLILLSFMVVLVSCYGAIKGVEGLARASFLILILVIISFVFIISTLIPQIDFNNYMPLLYDGKEQALKGVMLMLSRSTCIPALAMLLPICKGNKKLGLVVWNTAVYLIISLLIFVIVGSLGDYLKTQSFPVYTATCIAGIGILRKLDALYLGIWIMGLFIKISLFIYLSSNCVKKVFGQKSFKPCVFISGLFVAVLSFWISRSMKVISVVYDLKLIMILTLLTSILIPTFLLISNRVKIRSK